MSGCTVRYILILVAIWRLVVNITFRHLSAVEITTVGVEHKGDWAQSWSVHFSGKKINLRPGLETRTVQSLA
jgi:hypothetical protein